MPRQGQLIEKIEELKVHCTREHFKKISNNAVKYEVVDNYKALMDLVLKWFFRRVYGNSKIWGNNVATFKIGKW